MKTYCVTTAIIQDGEKYFIAKRAASKKIAPGLWEFITGFVEDHEAAEETIMRELAEEINKSGKIVKSLSVIQMDRDDERWLIIPFLVNLHSTDITTDPKEHSRGQWLTWGELEQLPTNELRYDLNQFKRVLDLKLHA